MRELKLRAEDFAKRMADEIYIKRAEDDFICAEQVPEEFINKILADPEHVKNMKGIIHDAVLLDVLENPDDYTTDAEGEFIYTHDACYDYGYAVDNYIEAGFEDTNEKARQARLKIRYKVWVEVERIEYDPLTDTETYHDEDNPFGIAYRDTIEEAFELQGLINNTFGEIS